MRRLKDPGGEKRLERPITAEITLKSPRLICTTATKPPNRNSPPQMLLKSWDVINKTIYTAKTKEELSKLKRFLVMCSIRMYQSMMGHIYEGGGPRL